MFESLKPGEIVFFWARHRTQVRSEPVKVIRSRETGKVQVLSTTFVTDREPEEFVWGEMLNPPDLFNMSELVEMLRKDKSLETAKQISRLAGGTMFVYDGYVCQLHDLNGYWQVSRLCVHQNLKQFPGGEK